MKKIERSDNTFIQCNSEAEADAILKLIQEDGGAKISNYWNKITTRIYYKYDENCSTSWLGDYQEDYIKTNLYRTIMASEYLQPDIDSYEII